MVRMMLAVCVIIVSHYTRISLSSTGVLLLLQTCYCYRCFFTLHLSCSLVNCIAVHCNAVYHTTHTQCIAVHCDKECNTQGSHCRSATGATASFTLHCLFSLQSIVTNSNTLQSSALQSITVQFSALQFQLSFQFEVQCSGKRCGGASCCVTEGSSKLCQAEKPRVPTR